MDALLPTHRGFGLIGYPLSHSFSQRFFTEKWAREGVRDCSYELFPISHIRDFPDVLAGHPYLVGLNVTIPYKEAVIAYLHELTEAAKTVGAVNVIAIRQGKLTGHNSDVFGFEQALSPHLKPWHRQALVLGTGGAAKAVVYVLQQFGINYRMVSRTSGINTLNYKQITPDIMNETGLIINTTPLGMYPQVELCPDLPYHAVTDRHLFFDLIYNPEKTLFLQRAEQNGALILNGYQMLVLQAEKSWEIWNR